MGVVWSPGVGFLGACRLYYLGGGMSGSSAQRLNEGTGSCLLPLSHHTVSHPQESLSTLTQSLTPGLQEASKSSSKVLPGQDAGVTGSPWPCSQVQGEDVDATSGWREWLSHVHRDLPRGQENPHEHLCR